MKYALILISLLLAACSKAATLDVKLEYVDGWKATPAVAVPGPTLKNLFGIRNLDPQLFGMVGVETPTDRFSLAGGIRFPARISDNLTVSAGPWVVLVDGSKPRLGLFIGFSLD